MSVPHIEHQRVPDLTDAALVRSAVAECDVVLHLAGLALLERLPDARNDAQLVLECRSGAARHRFVSLAEVLPPLGVADDRAGNP